MALHLVTAVHLLHLAEVVTALTQQPLEFLLRSTDLGVAEVEA